MDKKSTKNNSSCKACKICNKCFASGKAMGGHMRSHFAKLPIPPNPTITPTTNHVPPENPPAAGSTSTWRTLMTKTRSPSSSSSHTMHPRNDSPVVQNFRSLNRDFSAAAADNDDDDKDRESESDQSYPTRRRSKRGRKFIAVAAAAAAAVSLPRTKADEDEPKQATSSIFDALFPAIEAARSLVMLSKDKWPEGKEVFKKKQQQMEEGKEEDSNDDDNDWRIKIHSRGRRFECDMCDKVFGSYQALGGHKASHKKFKSINQWEEDDEEEYDGNNLNFEDLKGFECPYCSKVFESGQALGGHKKAHFSNAKKFGVNVVIDLNLPAPGEDEEVSNTDFSTMSSEDY